MNDPKGIHARNLVLKEQAREKKKLEKELIIKAASQGVRFAHFPEQRMSAAYIRIRKGQIKVATSVVHINDRYDYHTGRIESLRKLLGDHSIDVRFPVSGFLHSCDIVKGMFDWM